MKFICILLFTTATTLSLMQSFVFSGEISSEDEQWAKEFGKNMAIAMHTDEIAYKKDLDVALKKILEVDIRHWHDAPDRLSNWFSDYRKKTEVNFAKDFKGYHSGFDEYIENNKQKLLESMKKDEKRWSVILEKMRLQSSLDYIQKTSSLRKWEMAFRIPVQPEPLFIPTPEGFTPHVELINPDDADLLCFAPKSHQFNSWDDIPIYHCALNIVIISDDIHDELNRIRVAKVNESARDWSENGSRAVKVDILPAKGAPFISYGLSIRFNPETNQVTNVYHSICNFIVKNQILEIRMTAERDPSKSDIIRANAVIDEWRNAIIAANE